MNSSLENEKKFLKLVNLYDSNQAAFHAYIASLSNRPEYAKFGPDSEETIIDAIKGYKNYNDFMDIIQYFPDPDFSGFKSSGGKKKTHRHKKRRIKKSRKQRK
jgi:hypothetical protein